MADEKPKGGKLGDRSRMVFEQYLSDGGRFLHAEDREEAERFSAWLDGFERPAETEPQGAAASGRWPIWSAVAAIVVAVSAGAIEWQQWHVPGRQSYASFASGHAEQRAIRLEDGTVVRLAAESRVDVHYTTAERRVVLRAGEALFDVPHNPARPFVVAAADGEVTDVGTRFDLRVSRDHARVTVLSGAVRVGIPSGASSPSDSGIFREARGGQQVTYGMQKRGGSVEAFVGETRTVDPDNVVAWTRGKLYFDGEPLQEAIRIANDYSAQKLVLKDPRLRDMPVYGMLNQGDLTGLTKLVDDPSALVIVP